MSSTLSVFGRTSASHSYNRALAAWERSGEIAKMAMACNIRHDHRVSPERERHFDSFCRKPRTAVELEQAISTYFKEKVRTRHYPDFVYNEINGCNLISGYSKVGQRLAKDPRHDLAPELNKDRMLLRIIDLNGLVVPYRTLLHKRQRIRWWSEAVKSYSKIPRNLKLPDEQAWVDKWLKEMLDHDDEKSRSRFVAVVLSLLRTVRKASSFQPTWATTLDAFAPHARTADGKPNPDRWIQMMGLGKNTPGHWFIALAYTVAEAGTLARPTQLDGGWYEYHFPSPDETPREDGGLAMDLRITPAPTVLLPEYIHKEIDHTHKHWRDAGCLLGHTSLWRCSDLAETRRAHQRLLSSAYQTATYTTCPNRDVCKIC